MRRVLGGPCALLLGLACVATPGVGAAPREAPDSLRAAAPDSTTGPGAAAAVRPAPHFDHTIWSALLAANVDDVGRVAYKRVAETDMAALRTYLDAVARATPDAWPRDEQIAFWINAYNAGIVSAVLSGQSPETVIERARMFKSWKFPAAGRPRTPDEIEHEILRKKLVEPRIHFALVCAAMGCPPLRRSAYTADSLTLQLDDQARRFINNPQRNVVDPAGRRLRLSSIFDWFRRDFEAASGTLHRYVARYVNDAEGRQWLLDETPLPKFLDYDWTLNQQPFQRPAGKK
jgi:hypothetical protein